MKGKGEMTTYFLLNKKFDSKPMKLIRPSSLIESNRSKMNTKSLMDESQQHKRQSNSNQSNIFLDLGEENHHQSKQSNDSQSNNSRKNLFNQILFSRALFSKTSSSSQSQQKRQQQSQEISLGSIEPNDSNHNQVKQSLLLENLNEPYGSHHESYHEPKPIILGKSLEKYRLMRKIYDQNSLERDYKANGCENRDPNNIVKALTDDCCPKEIDQEQPYIDFKRSNPTQSSAALLSRFSLLNQPIIEMNDDELIFASQSSKSNGLRTLNDLSEIDRFDSIFDPSSLGDVKTTAFYEQEQKSNNHFRYGTGNPTRLTSFSPTMSRYTAISNADTTRATIQSEESLDKFLDPIDDDEHHMEENRMVSKHNNYRLKWNKDLAHQYRENDSHQINFESFSIYNISPNSDDDDDDVDRADRCSTNSSEQSCQYGQIIKQNYAKEFIEQELSRIDHRRRYQQRQQKQQQKLNRKKRYDTRDMILPKDDYYVHQMRNDFDHQIESYHPSQFHNRSKRFNTSNLRDCTKGVLNRKNRFSIDQHHQQHQMRSHQLNHQHSYEPRALMERQQRHYQAHNSPLIVHRFYHIDEEIKPSKALPKTSSISLHQNLQRQKLIEIENRFSPRISQRSTKNPHRSEPTARSIQTTRDQNYFIDTDDSASTSHDDEDEDEDDLNSVAAAIISGRRSSSNSCLHRQRRRFRSFHPNRIDENLYRIENVSLKNPIDRSWSIKSEHKVSQLSSQQPKFPCNVVLTHQYGRIQRKSQKNAAVGQNLAPIENGSSSLKDGNNNNDCDQNISEFNHNDDDDQRCEKKNSIVIENTIIDGEAIIADNKDEIEQIDRTEIDRNLEQRKQSLSINTIDARLSRDSNGFRIDKNNDRIVLNDHHCQKQQRTAMRDEVPSVLMDLDENANLTSCSSLVDEHKQNDDDADDHSNQHKIKFHSNKHLDHHHQIKFASIEEDDHNETNENNRIRYANDHQQSSFLAQSPMDEKLNNFNCNKNNLAFVSSRKNIDDEIHNDTSELDSMLSEFPDNRLEDLREDFLHHHSHRSETKRSILMVADDDHLNRNERSKFNDGDVEDDDDEIVESVLSKSSSIQERIDYSASEFVCDDDDDDDDISSFRLENDHHQNLDHQLDLKSLSRQSSSSSSSSSSQPSSDSKLLITDLDVDQHFHLSKRDSFDQSNRLIKRSQQLISSTHFLKSFDANMNIGSSGVEGGVGGGCRSPTHHQEMILANSEQDRSNNNEMHI